MQRSPFKRRRSPWWNRTDGAGTPGAGSPVHRASMQATQEVIAEPKVREAALLPTDLIGGDETIIFAIKPSLWFMVFDAGNWIVAAMLLFACAGFVTEVLPGLTENHFISIVLAAAAIRVGVAILRWVSCYYVLTDRRVMRLRGVFRAEVFAYPLVNIIDTTVTVSFPEALTHLGTLHFALGDAEHPPAGTERAADEPGQGPPAVAPMADGYWTNIANPQRVHTEVRNAIRRARNRQMHL